MVQMAVSSAISTIQPLDGKWWWWKKNGEKDGGVLRFCNQQIINKKVEKR